MDNKVLSEDLLLKIGNIKKNKIFKNPDSDSISEDELNGLLFKINMLQCGHNNMGIVGMI